MTSFFGTTASAQGRHAIARAKIIPKASGPAMGGRAVVLTKGTFDILHAGHLALVGHCIDEARRLDEDAVVVVVVESDASVRRRKGPSRPFQDESQRALQIAMLDGVDFVVVAGKEELGAVLVELRPVVYVKGMDTAVAGHVGDQDDQTVALPAAANPELASVDWPLKVVVFTDDGALSTSALARKIAAAQTKTP